MDKHIGDESAVDELVTYSDDKALRVLPPRRWSEAHSELTRPISPAQVKVQLNRYYPSRTDFHALVEYIGDLKAKIGGRTANRETNIFRTALLYILVFIFKTLSPDSIFVISWPYYLFTSQPVELWPVSTTDQLQSFENLMMDTLRYRQLEILCRYGDYLAESLGTLRQHISENNLETEHKLSGYWTETSTILRGEEEQETTPCHNLIRTAAQGLNWNQEVTIFMVHEYAKRNNLMHAELFNLVDGQD